MIDEDYLEQHDLIWMAVEGLCRVFEMQVSDGFPTHMLIPTLRQGTTSRTDFCRILATEGVLLPLAEALLNSAEDDDELAESAKIKICSIFHIFAQSDLKVKESMAVRPVISRTIPFCRLQRRAHPTAGLVKALDLLQGDLLVTILKTIRGLTMSSKALEVLQNADVIQVLVRIMKDHLHSSYSTVRQASLAHVWTAEIRGRRLLILSSLLFSIFVACQNLGRKKPLPQERHLCS